MVGGGVSRAGGGVGGSVTSGKVVVVVSDIPRVVVGVAECLVASTCSGSMVVRFRRSGDRLVVNVAPGVLNV